MLEAHPNRAGDAPHYHPNGVDSCDASPLQLSFPQSEMCPWKALTHANGADTVRGQIYFQDTILEPSRIRFERAFHHI
jgi:hypothetical protein